MSEFSLKAELLHNGNIHPSKVTAHSVHMKETYKNLDLLCLAVSYSIYGWEICGDLTVTGLLLRLQSGYTKFCCFLCEWHSRAKDKHCKIKDWPMPESSVPGEKCVRNQLLVDKDKILFTATTQ